MQFTHNQQLSTCKQLAELIREMGGRAVVVGGGVRDCLLEIPTQDLDLEVFGLSIEEVECLVRKHFRVIKVGKYFCVLKLPDHNIDISIPRIEVKSGIGHKDFIVEGRPMLSFEEAASRRDFTINAISWDPLTEVVIDPFEGVKDLNARILRHVSEKFSEDPLRVLRAMQFVARFELSVAPETLELCRSLTIEGISKERIYEEFKKLVVMGKKPSMGLQFLKDCGWIKYFPELSQLIDCQQDPEKHPEGDVWTHTLLALDAFAQARTGVEWEDLVVGLAVLCHDLGKPQATTVDERGAIHALGHETVGVDVALNFLQRITSHKKLMDGVLELVGMHMYPAALFRDREKIRDATMRRFLRKVEHVDRLCRVVEADMAGKRSSGMPITSWLKDRIASLPAGLESPLVKGKHLISLGLPPGPIFKKILDDCFAAQIDGKFSTIKEGIEYLRKLFFSREKKKFPNLQKKSDIGRHFLGT